MDREQLRRTISAADPQPGDLVDVERRGDCFAWQLAVDGGRTATTGPPDAWIYYSWRRPLGDHDARAVVDDLLAEMETMTGCGGDRCRWPLDEPWPLAH